MPITDNTLSKLGSLREFLDAMDPEDMARMNEARAVFNELRSILLAQVVPALGGGTNPMATEIEARLEAITFASRNFLWPHRHAGADHRLEWSGRSRTACSAGATG